MSSAAHSRAERLADALIEAAWLGALVLIPLVFNGYSEARYELEKVVLLRSVATVIAVAWTIKLVGGGWRHRPMGVARRLPPFLLAAALVSASYVISSSISVVPRASWLGSYSRQQGTVTALCYGVIFLAVAFHLRRSEQWRRARYAMVMTSVPISAQAVAERLQIDPLGLGELASRSVSTLGNPIFLAGYLIFPIFVAGERFVAAGRASARAVYGAILLLQLAAFVGAQSRGPAAGLLAGFAVAALAALILWKRSDPVDGGPPTPIRRLRRWAWLAPPVVVVVVFAVLAASSSPGAPLAGLRQAPYVGRLSRVLEVGGGSARVRFLIWRGVADLFEDPTGRLPPTATDPQLGLRRLFGFGPETLLQVIGRDYPVELGERSGWNTIPDRAHNETFDALAGRGLFGITGLLFLFLSIFHHAVRWVLRPPPLPPTRAPLILMLGGIVAGIAIPLAVTGSLQLAAAGIPIGVLGGLSIAILRDGFNDTPGPVQGPHAILILMLLAVFVAHFAEIEIGIAVTTTRTYFWALLGALSAVGGGRMAASIGRAERIRESRAPDSGQRAAPFGLLCGIAVTAFTFDLFVPTVSAEGPQVATVLGGLLWGVGGRRVGAVWLLALTVFAGLALWRVERRAVRGPRRLGDFLLPGLLAPTVFVLLHAGRIAGLQAASGGTLESEVGRLASFFSAYYVVAMALLLALAVVLRSIDYPDDGGIRPGLVAAALVFLVATSLLVTARPGLDAIRADVFFDQAEALAAARQWGPALLLYNRAVDGRPLEDRYHYGRGAAYFEWAREARNPRLRERRFGEAGESLGRAAELNPLDPSHHANLGRLLTAWGRGAPTPERRQELWSEGLRHYDHALELHPRSPELAAERAGLDALIRGSE